MRIVNLAQLSACERQYLIARGWHSSQANRKLMWIAPKTLHPTIVAVDNQDIAVHFQKQYDRREKSGG